MGSWQVEKTLYKHQAGVTALALHPSGKLAFSAAKDKKMITWNLVKANPAFITYIKGIAEMIVVSPDGSRYAVGLHRKIDIYSMETAGVEYSIDLKVDNIDILAEPSYKFQTRISVSYFGPIAWEIENCKIIGVSPMLLEFLLCFLQTIVIFFSIMFIHVEYFSLDPTVWCSSTMTLLLLEERVPQQRFIH